MHVNAMRQRKHAFVDLGTEEYAVQSNWMIAHGEMHRNKHPA